MDEYLPPLIADKVRVSAQHGDKYWARNEADTYDRVL